ncbi:hypothetical protein EXIGLDRAFT_741085 [Exidia glandulosa HHB12029]|uniref:AB hydrolase-1 domain-containing protein n=1 Tax=Exidia glandulosa HHB12029 TaxID=1314781 RepID=A0A165FDC5_EXIGL|nr:hypothetical protein EXIGLDRAFT_741085 [Exidia glandulosa HHB12029]
MLGTSRVEYVLIRTTILALRSVTPLSFIYVATWTALRWIPLDAIGLPPYWTSRLRLPGWTLTWPLLECAFYIAVYLPWSHRLQQAAVHPDLRPRAERERLFELCHDHIPDINSYTAGWYLGSGSSELRRDNVEDWILWAVFGSSRADMKPEWKDELESYVQRIEGLVGHDFEPGYNPNVKSIRLTLDDVETLHRPLLWYMIVMLVDSITYGYLFSQGFRHYTPVHAAFSVFPVRPLVALLSTRSSSPFPYWIRPHTSSTKKPVLFLHGIGIGLWPYTPFFKEFSSLEPNVGVICVEFLPISFRITAPMPDRTTTVAGVHTVLEEHFPIDQDFVVLSHSYGTVVAAHFLHADHARVAAMVMVDPIPLLLHLPSTAHNFVYRRPGMWRANEHQLWYFASRDPGVAHTLSRRFFWGDNILWKSDLQGVRSAVVLSERDQIIPASEVWTYLTGSKIDWADKSIGLAAKWKSPDDEMEVMFYRDVDHSQVFETAARRAGLLDALRRVL